ncbi:MAG: 16S rRNA (uracil(1498)-N(3))-methyltransferase [Alphaproteobacteria bacterium]
MARFFLPRSKIEGRRGIIAGAELEHLRRVLRMRPGDHIIAFDDSGWEHEAVIRALNDAQGELEILRSYQADRESPLAATLAVALIKGDKMDYVVEKATELGVKAIAPFVSRYTVPKLNDRKAVQRAERWRKIALSAAKQCGRTCLPEVFPVCDYHELIGERGAAELKLFFWEREAEQTLTQVRDRQARLRSVFLVIGPEGGFTVDEAEMARARGYTTVHLGPRVLRAETAALTALSLVQYLWGDFG